MVAFLVWVSFLLFFPFQYIVQLPGLKIKTERWQDISYVPRMLSLPSLQVTNAFTVIPVK